MEKIWLTHYPSGVAETINPDSYASLVELFDECCKRYSSKPSYSNFGAKITYQKLDELTHNLAAFFQKKLHLKKRDRIAIMMPNLLQYPVTMFAALRAGLVVVNVNPLYTAPELKHQLSDSGAKAIVVLENFVHVVEAVLPDVPIEQVVVTKMGDLFTPFKGSLVNFVVKYVRRLVPAWNIPHSLCFKEALQAGGTLDFEEVPVTGKDTAFLQYTGGTTGVK